MYQTTKLSPLIREFSQYMGQFKLLVIKSSQTQKSEGISTFKAGLKKHGSRSGSDRQEKTESGSNQPTKKKQPTFWEILTGSDSFLKYRVGSDLSLIKDPDLTITPRSDWILIRNPGLKGSFRGHAWCRIIGVHVGTVNTHVNHPVN